MIAFAIERLVPRFLMRDKNGRALAKAIEAALKYYCHAVGQGTAIIEDVSQMPEWRLDEMAWELGATWYDSSAELERKRAQIAGAEEYYNRLGTPGAVQRAIADVYGDGVVEEWFAYGGEPYHFTVRTSNTTVLMENRTRFLKLVDIVKNVRSVLDNVVYEGEAKVAVRTGAAICGATGSASAMARRRSEGEHVE